MQQILNLFAATALALAVPIQAGCYSGGEGWGNTQVALNAANNFCNQIQGDIEGNGNRYTCVNGNGKRLEFNVIRLGGTSRPIFWSECYDGLQKEIGCSNGGDSSYTNWRYM
jgi:hypothetical protein